MQINKNLIIAAAILILVTMTTTTSNAEAIIKKFEGKRLKAYKDSGGIYTIGYGSIYNWDKNRPVISTDVIDDTTALNWLRKEIGTKSAEIKKLIKVPVNQNMFDSLTSLAYNIGTGTFKKSTLLRLLNSGSNKNLVADEFLKWNKVKGNIVPGLTNRRILEKELFLK
jgi:GH24 family phage-related lysozyme (muramidase)